MPPASPIHRLTRLVVPACCALLLGACAATQEDAAGNKRAGNYRTIQTEPLRDTDSAARANAEGLAHLDAGELYQAEQAFKQALEADIEYGPAHNHLGKVYFLKRDFYRAAHEFDKAGKLMPRVAAPQYNLGLTLMEAGQTDEAVEYFRKATTLEPGEVVYQADLARALLERGEQTEEVVALLRAVAARDERVAWRAWASHELARIGGE